MLRVDVTKALEATTVEAAFDSAGGVTALFGPSGAGKTSLINMIAGLMKPDRGRIEVDGETLDDTTRRIHVPAHRRRIGYVFQDARLFPHLSVAQNLDYGRRMNGLPFDAAEQARIAQLLDLEDLRERRPGKLSGGEKQRVALGRALLVAPAAVAAGRATRLARRGAEGGDPALSDAAARPGRRADGLCQPRRRRGAAAGDTGDPSAGGQGYGAGRCGGVAAAPI